jgi:hypothetical protein
LGVGAPGRTAVVAKNLGDAQAAQAQARKARQVGQPFVSATLEHLLCLIIWPGQGGVHFVTHLKGLRTNAWAQPCYCFRSFNTMS